MSLAMEAYSYLYQECIHHTQSPCCSAAKPRKFDAPLAANDHQQHLPKSIKSMWHTVYAMRSSTPGDLRWRAACLIAQTSTANMGYFINL
jgi:hypothetical protein